MSKIWLIAAREFVATVFTKAFLIGLLIFPAMIVIGVMVVPRLFSNQAFLVSGQVIVVDATGEVLPQLRAASTEGTPAAALTDVIRRARAAQLDDDDVLEVLGVAPKLTLVERPADADLDEAKAWLLEKDAAAPHLALVVIHPNAVRPVPGETDFGSYDLYVPPSQDVRVEGALHQALREAIITLRVGARGLDRVDINNIVTVARVRSVTVSEDAERSTVGALNIMMPFAFMMLLLMSVMGSGQAMLTSTVEEKSSRVIEVLLSAVSPMQLMAGKLLAHMGVSLIAMGLYLGLGLVALASFSLFGLLDLALIPYLIVFFLIGFLTLGSFMMAVGAAVNDMREAQTLIMPVILVSMAPWFVAFPIARDPSSTLAVVVSFLPPLNTFGMLLRLASTSPPPVWQALLSIAIGMLGVVAALWFAAKVFRIGLLMFGKPPNLATLFRWIRAA